MRRVALAGLVGVLLAGGLAAPFPLAQAAEPTTYEFTVVDQVDVTTRYGDTINIDLCFPSLDGETPAPGKFPVIGELSPYVNVFGVNVDGQAACFMPEGVQTGYVGARINSPGSGDSEGGPWDFGDPSYALRHYDAIEWLAAQPWSTGKFGSVGGSGVGVSQVQTSAYKPPHYTTAIFQISTGDAYTSLKPGGMRHATELLVCTIPGVAVTANNGVVPPTSPERVQRMVDFQRDRISNPSTSTPGHCPPVHGSWGHPVRDAYWDARTADLEKVEMPVWVQGAQDDLFSLGSQDDYFTLGSKNKMFAMGYTSHAGNKEDCEGCDFPQSKETLRWFDHWLKGIDRSDPTVAQGKTVSEDLANRRFRYNVFPDMTPKSAKDYPIPTTKYTNFYLNGGAPDPLSNGSLSLTPPTADGAATYVYTPADGKNYNGFGAGESHDQRVEQGTRVSFVGDVLPEDTEVTGPITMKLFAKTTATDTDWVAKLHDVAPDGTMTHAFTNGYLKSTFRSYKGDYRFQSDTPPGEVVEYDILFYPTSWMFKKDHRIAVSISSSDLGEIYPNPNPAVIDVLYGPQTPSAIRLPVIPAASTNPVEDSVKVACTDCDIQVRGGQTGTADLEVTNTGSEATTVSMSSSAPAEWQSSVAPASLALGAGESRTVALTVRPPKNARETAAVTVTATTAGGATGSDTVNVQATKPGNGNGAAAGSSAGQRGTTGAGGDREQSVRTSPVAALSQAVTGPAGVALALLTAAVLGSALRRRRTAVI